MSSIQDIPFDILELIAEQYARQTASAGETKRHLATCRLASRTFAKIFEPYLFRDGVFRDETAYNSPRTSRRACNILQVMTKRPSLGNHVKKFTLSLSMETTHRHLPTILGKMGRLQSLEVKAGENSTGTIDWRHLFVPLKRELTKLVSERECLRELVFERIASIPHSLLLHTPHLKQMTLRAVNMQYQDNTKAENRKFSGIAAPREQFDLDISFSPAQWIEVWLSAMSNQQSFLGRIRCLKVTYSLEDELHVSEILRICGRYGESLEVLDVTFLRSELNCTSHLCLEVLPKISSSHLDAQGTTFRPLSSLP